MSKIAAVEIFMIVAVLFIGSKVVYFIFDFIFVVGWGVK